MFYTDIHGDLLFNSNVHLNVPSCRFAVKCFAVGRVAVGRFAVADCLSRFADPQLSLNLMNDGCKWFSSGRS